MPFNIFVESLTSLPMLIVICREHAVFEQTSMASG